MSYRVHIKIADRGWILEKCASEIAGRAANVSFGENADPGADIQYYVNYSARGARVSPVELAFFTHSEENENARRRYFQVACEVDAAVCMSKRYADELSEAGVANIATISPGVDLAAFKPKVKIGVVGRTYHTGRKGEALVASVLDIDGIEWKFTGKGWPGESVQIPEAAMPDFYNGLDYLLIPSYFEGGPMSVLEALACGVPIISSDVGWVNEFPHIPFENGNADSLRAVLQGIVNERLKLAHAVEGRTWDAWADAHLALFDRLAPKATGTDRRTSKQEPPLKAVLLTHGSEATTMGGPTVRVPRTVAALARYNIDATLLGDKNGRDVDATLAHVFNAWPARSALSTLLDARRAGKATVFSPIFLNLSQKRIFDVELPRLFEDGKGAAAEAELNLIAQRVAAEPNLPTNEPVPGYHSMVRASVAAADTVILLSEHERLMLESIGADVSKAQIVHNAVDAGRFAAADGELFAQTYGVRDYVLCVGRIEARKNQLLVAHATRALQIPVVFVGHDAAPKYAQLVRDAAGPDAVFIPRIDHDSPLLASAYAGAAVFTLPSWAEGAPLVAMEAAAAGAPLVLSDRSGEVEYFGGFAEYVNPADLGALKTALRSAIAKRGDADRRLALQKHMAENFSWDRHAQPTAAAYRATPPHAATDVPNVAENGNIYFDLTTTYHFKGMPTGIARLERDVYLALAAYAPDRMVPVVWNSRSSNYLMLPLSEALRAPNIDELQRMETAGTARLLAEDAPPSGSQILMVGGAWIRNARFIEALSAVKARLDIPLFVLVHDLIQMKLKASYPDGAGEVFEKHARLIADIADAFLTYSDTTRTDLGALLRQSSNGFKRILRFRMGSTLEDVSGRSHSGARPSEPVHVLEGKRFALYVSSIDPRKNHVLLVNVWRRLIEERGNSAPHLAFVGRPFWKGEEIIAMVQRDPLLSRHIHILSDVGDDDLDWCYRNATLTLYPSLYEGWGLPIAESLSYGKFCIAADASSTREVAPTLTDLVDPYDFRAWLNRVTLYFDNPAALAAKETKIRAEYVPYSWAEAVEDIVGKLDAQPRHLSPSSPLMPYTRLAFGDAEELAAKTALGAGWGKGDATSRPMIQDEAQLRFAYLGAGPDFRVRVWIRNPAGKDPQRVAVTIDGIEAGDFSVTGKLGSFDLHVHRGDQRHAATQLVLKADGQSAAPRLSIAALSVADTVADLDELDRAAKRAAAAAARAAAAPAPPKPAAHAGSRPTTNSFGRPSTDDLVKILVGLKAPSRLSNRFLVFRLLKLLGLERLTLRLYRKLMRRPYDAISVVVKYLLAEANAEK